MSAFDFHRFWGRSRAKGWSIEVALWSLPRPFFSWYWRDNEVGSFGFGLGNGNSDPVVAIDTPDFVPPAWLHPLLDRFT